MSVSVQSRVERPRGMETPYSGQDGAILENLAVPAGGLAERPRGDAGGAMERAHEIGEIAKSDIVGDIGDGDVLAGEQPRGLLEAGTHQILVRCHAEHARKLAQEMEGGDTGLIGGGGPNDLAPRVCLDPQRRFNGAAAISRARLCYLARPPGDHLDEAAGEQLTDLVEAEIPSARGPNLRQHSQHPPF